MIKKDTIPPVCALDYAFRRIGGKHKARILWYIFKQDNVMRYGELKKRIQNITSKMLTQTLRELEEDGLLNRKVYAQVPPKVEYSLTTTGMELIPFIDHIGAWGRKQMEKESQ
ncbi:helix-turn-helix transcriptional regulator [Carboxylicivirga mesophila]|uniref:Helix-turn-helix transcriptional regulator n=1 Tax=Carboxylicivirga mesophila TaxID=1166478 RepID=A0ABS5KBY3_9BACT|nr:helix-turn-helix domain-containing protein [Carboxylicivirga mesophila]MBS2212003.1 helix-turn-helix transcriptional regulator [Carboxylicivirga mesophila]